MNRSPLRRRAAPLATIGFAGIALFQLALVAGVPWGHAAWGGADAHLSTAQRLGSAAAVVVWTAAALIVLGRAGLLRAGGLASLFRWGTWFVVALLGIGALMNFASHSRWANLIFGPLALLLTIVCTIVARSATDDAADEAGRTSAVRIQ
jgi:hypothetical protein